MGCDVHLGDPQRVGWEDEGPGDPGDDLAPQRGPQEPLMDCETAQLRGERHHPELETVLWNVCPGSPQKEV